MDSNVNEDIIINHIEPNSPTLLLDESTSRFSSAIWTEKMGEQNILLAGLGGIGSYVGFLLSRLQVLRITMYDPDTVDCTNLSGQLYGVNDIDNYKTDALTRAIHNLSDYHRLSMFREPYTYDSLASSIMICGFDNMEARKVFYNSWINHINRMHPSFKSKALFIDGRLAAEEFQVFCIQGNDDYHKNLYEKKWLFSDEEADATVCSYKQTSHCATMIASVMTNLLTNFIANQCEPLVPRDVPFMTSYDATTMYFKTLS